MKENQINYYNEKTPTSLVINITAYLVPYKIVYPMDYVKSKFFNVTEAKTRIPIILGINANQRSKITNHVVASLHDYVKFLDDYEKLK
jgi:hypothetical protein